MNIVARPWEPQDLIDDLQQIIDEEPDRYLNGRRTTLCMARDFLKEHFAESGWISVEERLPQETGEVCRVVNLMMDSGLVTAGWLNDITGLGYFLDSRSSFIRQAPISRFTNWMPLPSKPEEEV